MSLFKKPSELVVKSTIKMLIYGQPGIGKSTLALSSPSPVLLDFDGGVSRINGSVQCPTLQVNQWEDVIEAMKEDLSDFETIVIDTAGKMLDYMSAYIIKTNSKLANRDGGLTLQGYGKRKQMFIDFLGMCSTMGKNLVFVAHEREEKKGDLKVIRPEIGGSSAGDLIKELDLVGYMEAIGRDRTIGWNPTEEYYAKNTCNLPPKYAVTAIFDENGTPIADNNFLEIVFSNYNKYLQDTKNRRVEYDKLVASFAKGVNAVKSIDDANSTYTKIESYKGHVWDSKIKAERMLEVHCSKLGFVFNQIDSKYETAA